MTGLATVEAKIMTITAISWPLASERKVEPLLGLLI